jgi:hypothetical protein
VRKDVTEKFRRLFAYLEQEQLYSHSDPIHRATLFVVFQPRIQADLEAMIGGWNIHKVRTAENQAPEAMWHLGRLMAHQGGYWEDPVDEGVGDDYGIDGAAVERLGPERVAEMEAEDVAAAAQDNDEGELGQGGPKDDDIDAVSKLLEGFDLARDDGRYGMIVYLEAVERVRGKLEEQGFM